MTHCGSGLDGLDLQKRIYARLDGGGDRALVADDPAVVVDAAHGVGVVAGLDVEQVVLQRLRAARRRPAAAAAGRRSPSPTAARRPRRPAGRRVDANTSPCPGSTTTSRSRRRGSARTRSPWRPASAPETRLTVPSFSSAVSTVSGTASGRPEHVDLRASCASSSPPRSRAGRRSAPTHSSGSPDFAAQPAAGIAYSGRSEEATRTAVAGWPAAGARSRSTAAASAAGLAAVDVGGLVALDAAPSSRPG